jgi:hypothetical protein
VLIYLFSLSSSVGLCIGEVLKKKIKLKTRFMQLVGFNYNFILNILNKD